MEQLWTRTISHRFFSLASTSRKSYSHFHTIHKTVTRPTHNSRFRGQKRICHRGLDIFSGIGFTLAFSMSLLGAPACRAEASKRRLTSRRPVGSRKPELAGKPALPGTAPRFRGSRREMSFRGLLSPIEWRGRKWGSARMRPPAAELKFQICVHAS